MNTTTELAANCLLCDLLRRAEAAERERDELRLELLKLRQDIARHSAGMLRLVWTPEKIVEWANNREGIAK